MAKQGITEAQRKAQELHKARQEAKVARRLTNQEARAKRTAEEQLARLDSILGKGQGARKERARLLAEIKARKAAPTPKKTGKKKKAS